MKRLLVLMTLIAGISFQPKAQIDLDSETMKGSTLLLQEGQTLVYGVDYYGDEYDFIVNVKSLKDGIEFDYKMTNDAGTEGTVNMSKEAVEKAINQFNYFGGGKVDLEDKTSVWVSTKVFNELVSSAAASTISADGGKTQVELEGAEPGHDFTVHNAISGKDMDNISYIYAQSDDGKAKYWIHMSKYNPLILKMDLGWKIWLKELRKD
jgi:hypothetical protein